MEDLQETFEQIFEGVLVKGAPVKILKDTGNAVLVSEEVWRGLAETLSLGKYAWHARLNTRWNA